MRYGAERRSEALVRANRRADSRCVEQASIQSEVQVLQRETWCDLERSPYKEGVMSSSMVRDIGCLGDVLSPGVLPC